MFRRTNPAKFSLSVANFNPVPSPLFLGTATIVGGFYAAQSMATPEPTPTQQAAARKRDTAQKFQEGKGPNPYYEPWGPSKDGSGTDRSSAVGVGGSAAAARNSTRGYDIADQSKRIATGGSGKAGDVFVGVTKAN